MKLVLKIKEEGIQSAPGGPKVGDAGGSSYQSPSFRMMDEIGLEDAGRGTGPNMATVAECGCGCEECSVGSHHEEPIEFSIDSEEFPQFVVEPDMVRGLYDEPEMMYITIDEDALQEGKKKKGDRCVRIAKRKYNRWPSAYASGAVVKCRQGKIWKGLKESVNPIEFEIFEATIEEAILIVEEWSKKYKRSIDCSNPKGFSQRAHCQGRKKHEEQIFEGAFDKEKSQGLHGWFSRNRGKGWIDCRTGKPCGRQKAGRGAKRKYPACRPTKAQCNKAGTRRKKGKAAISWKRKKDK